MQPTDEQALEKVSIELRPRLGVGELIEQYVAKEISYAELLDSIASLGYKTTNVYEMVRAIEAQTKDQT